MYAVKDGEVIATYTKGELENNKPIKADTSMPIGDVSSQFCAVTILLLQEQGKLDISDTLDKYYPDYKCGKEVTLKNMLSMRSGIPDYIMSRKLMNKIISENKSVKETMQIIKNWIFNKDLEFEPDKRYGYSCSNYFLLGEIVEKVSGEKYIDFLRKNFFEPLGMNNTGSVCELESKPEWAQGTLCAQDNPLLFLGTIGDRDIISNGPDMALWIKGISCGKVISKESYKAMIKNYSKVDFYGYGFDLNVADSIGYSGFTDVYSTIEYFNEQDNLFVFMVNNNSDFNWGGTIFNSLISYLQK